MKMEKVKVTQEQAHAIEMRLSKENAIRYHASSVWDGPNKCLNDLTLDEFVRALYIGYEIEPDFKVGDWVTSKNSSSVAKITEIIHQQVFGEWSGTGEYGYNIKCDLRHATPEEIATEKQRRWWAKHDRKSWETKKGDLLKHRHNSLVYEVSTRVDGYVIYFKGGSSCAVMKLEDIYEVVCFAEDRKDIGS